ncbi:MAG: NAD(P)/FAD-dependent oxidoreductase [Rubrobacter sp.]|nr:NAD(P)/FAD-dependent oxidoreductase [Rubrobacter sp.]
MTRERPDATRRARLVVVGAGFAGASLLAKLPAGLQRPGETLLVDRQEQWEFVPLIHEVAVGRVHPDTTRSPIAPLCKDRCGSLRAAATGVDLEARTLHTTAGTVGYEYLVLAGGSSAAPPPEDMAGHFQTFWSLDDALLLRSSLASAWKRARRGEPQPGGLTVALVGGGTTGVELAAEVAVLLRYLGKRSSRPLEDARVVLFEASDRLMGWLDPYFHEVAMERLLRLGVEVRLNTPVEAADPSGVGTPDGWVPAGTRVWTGGVRANPLVESLPVEKDAAGRALVGEYLTLPGHPEVYVLGDGGVYEDLRYGPLPPTASVAVQQGPWAARDLGARVRGAPRYLFDYFDRGYLVSLGPGDAVGRAAGAKVRGAAAHALYRSVFLYYQRGRRDRLLTGVDWAMSRAIGRLGFD